MFLPTLLLLFPLQPPHLPIEPLHTPNTLHKRLKRPLPPQRTPSLDPMLPQPRLMEPHDFQRMNRYHKPEQVVSLLPQQLRHLSKHLPAKESPTPSQHTSL